MTFNSYPWFTAEGTDRGKPVLYRGREFPQDNVDRPEFPCLLVMSVRYPCFDWTGLPTREQYDELARFEQQLDSLESTGGGVIAFIRTSNGLVDYYLYVGDSQVAADILGDHFLFGVELEFASADDPQWNKYKAFLAGTRDRESMGPDGDRPQ